MSNADETTIEIVPIINYPRVAFTGHTYAITVDFEARFDSAAWPYEEEEYVIFCDFDENSLSTIHADGEPAVIIHRFGGSYGPASFQLITPLEPSLDEIALTLTT